MIHNISESIQDLAVDVDLLQPLEKNARVGDVDAIMASYTKFGQVKPIVAVREDTGVLTVIAGNHQLEAAKQLGWQQIAVSVVDLSVDDALAFALADNRISDLGSTDNEILYDLLSTVIHDDDDFFETLGWDDFSVAAIENSVLMADIASDSNAGWIAPEIVVNDISSTSFEGSSSPQPTMQSEPSSDQKSFNQEPTTRTETTQPPSKPQLNASVQFTLLFEKGEQHSKWYAFIKWLKENPTYPGDTMSEMLLNFVLTHSEID